MTEQVYPSWLKGGVITEWQYVKVWMKPSEHYSGEWGRHLCWEPAWEIPPMTRSCGETWRARWVRSQGVLYLSILPPNQNLSVYCLLYYTLLTLQGAILDHLSLEKVNLELQLVSCIWKECFSSNPSDGSLTCLTVGDFYNLWLFTAPQPWEVWSLKHLKDIEPFRAKNWFGEGLHCWVNVYCQASISFIFQAPGRILINVNGI